jgi:hypothetical protein
MIPLKESLDPKDYRDPMASFIESNGTEGEMVLSQKTLFSNHPF